MANFPFNDTIPAANNNPSADQSLMLSNNVSEKAILAVDHVTFGAENGGTHLQTAFQAFSTGNIPTNSDQPFQPCVAYPAAGTADNTRSQFFFKNSNNVIFPASLIKAWAFCSGTTTSPTNSVLANQQNNIVSVIRNSIGNYTVTLGSNVVVGTNYAVLGQIIPANSYSGIANILISITSQTSFIIKTFGWAFPGNNTSNYQISDFPNFAFTVIQI